LEKILNNLAQKAKQAASQNKVFVKKLKKKKPKNLDNIVHGLHKKVFEKIDCLSCANCCKTLGPRITDHDITKLAKHFKIKPGKFIENHLKLDEDNDYVFKQMPCPFLLPDNYCMVYEKRPKACREYPHTDRKRFYQALDISLKNTAVCPAVFEIMEQLKQIGVDKMG